MVLPGLLPADLSQRPIGADQSNTTVVVGERLALKMYRRLEPGRHPDIEIGQYLTERASVAFVPAYAGAVRWRGHAIAMLQAYVSNAEDGLGVGSRARCRRARSATSRGWVRTAAPCTGRWRSWSRGRPRPPSSATGGGRPTRSCDRVLELVDADTRAELQGYAPRLREEFAAVEQGPPPLLTRVHGDYHIGQILRSRDGLRVVDFEGEPTKGLAERNGLGTPLRDVAAMLRSFDHLARHVDRDLTPGHRRRIEALDRERAGGLPGGLRRSRSAAAARARGREGDLRVRLRRHVPARMDVRSDGRDAVADGGAGAVNSEGFLADILAEPEALERVVAAYGGRHLERMLDRPRLLLIGMGSSGYAAGTAVSALRSRGLDAHAELASTGTPQPAAPDTLAMLISASGGSGETLEALRRHSGASRVLAITNTPRERSRRRGGRFAGRARRSRGGWSRLPQLRLHTGGAGADVRRAADDIRMAAAAVAQLIEGRERWLPPLVEVAEAARGVWVCGPAERFGSAQQSALMLREGPRIIADACETGDWLHVDVYLTKPPGYSLLLLGGSRYDAEVAGWRRERDFRLVSVGRELAGADAAITDRRCRAAGGGGDRRDGRGGAAGGRAVAEEPDLTRGGLAPGPDGRERCWWGVSTPDYMAYHDAEWGRPVTDDQGIYERLTLEAFQSGLSWLTILRKRQNFRAAFAGFEIERGGGL